jgi:hypothetical protein
MCAASFHREDTMNTKATNAFDQNGFVHFVSLRAIVKKG